MNEDVDVIFDDDNFFNGYVDNGFVFEQKPQNSNLTSNSLALKPVCELLSEDMELVWLVDNYIIQDTLNMLYAKPSSGKSVTALSFAVAVATGCDWYGQKTRQGSVVYIAGEGRDGLIRRLKAIELSLSIDLKNIPLFVSNESAMIDTIGGINAINSAIDKFEIKPSLIVIDTLARSFAGDENSASSMNQFIIGCDSIRRRYPNCTMLIVHHTGLVESKRARGSSALFGAIDRGFLLHVDSKSKIHEFSCDKARDGSKPPAKHFELKEVVLDNTFDSFGATITSVVFEEVAHYDANPTLMLKANDYLLMSILLKNNIYDLNVENVRDTFISSCSSSSADAKRKAFTRSLGSVVDLGLITQDGKKIVINMDVVSEYNQLSKLNYNIFSETIH